MQRTRKAVVKADEVRPLRASDEQRVDDLAAIRFGDLARLQILPMCRALRTLNLDEALEVSDMAVQRTPDRQTDMAQESRRSHHQPRRRFIRAYGFGFLDDSAA